MPSDATCPKTQRESGCTFIWRRVKGKTSPILLCLPCIYSGTEGFMNKRWAQKMTSKTKKTSQKKPKQTKTKNGVLDIFQKLHF